MTTLQELIDETANNEAMTLAAMEIISRNEVEVVRLRMKANIAAVLRRSTPGAFTEWLEEDRKTK